MTVKITRAPFDNDVNIENDGACRDQQGDNEPSFRRIHYPGTLLYWFRKWGSAAC
jgi:hypothetical protein